MFLKKTDVRGLDLDEFKERKREWSTMQIGNSYECLKSIQTKLKPKID